MIVFAAVSNCNFYILNFDYCVYVCMCYTVHVCASRCLCLCSGRVCMQCVLMHVYAACVCIYVCSCALCVRMCACTCVCACMHLCVCVHACMSTHTPWYMYKLQAVKLALQVLLPTDSPPWFVLFCFLLLRELHELVYRQTLHSRQPYSLSVPGLQIFFSLL